ncbi:HEXXH motif-containing putative peptide modification protein [Sphingomonas sp. PP-CC-3G-468]|uniref:aKG-HExxH-type peptide beta-hydroxylase n=1 Tax=Sphingomonas sp. PP-CC-3G-468 TaxID=2135656 RepID=UPI001045A811|nr:HEXXH motif-containing putative peptide modification protein [Sphingomonas sp. PP-CC-3G-468]TCM07460.1 HEXXH motif-containing protein [Sphingomonas sp. PP-CC-3G-468]
MDAALAPWRLPGRGLGPETSASSTWLADRIADPGRKVADRLVRQGLIVLAPSAIHHDVCRCAQNMIEECADLADAVRTVTQHVHLLDASPGYDVSHSEPRWLNRIFVSVPDRRDEVGALRFAEGVIHEAMHLALTLLELQHPLVRGGADMMPSPWRHEPRPTGGVLHGLFVFSCLHAAFRELSRGCRGAAAEHVRGRLDDISAEVLSIDLKTLSAGLTPLGCELAHDWSQGVSRAARSAAGYRTTAPASFGSGTTG